MWDYFRTDFNEFRRQLHNHDFSYCTEDGDIENMVNDWVNDFLGIVEANILHKLVTVHPHDKPWFSGYLR